VSDDRWRFIDSGPRTGAENMALDEAMLEAHLAGDTSPTLRVYTWSPPAVSLGRFQRVEDSVDLEACRSLGIDVVRRPTGGRAILHTEEEVTFSLVVSRERLGTLGVMDSYRALARGIVAALQRLGLAARLVERAQRAASPTMARDPACFAVKARCDIVAGSAKLVGSAQVQRDGLTGQGVLLQQNSLPLRIRPEHWREVFLRSGEKPEAMGLWDAAGREISYPEVAEALRAGFAEALALEFDTADLSASEQSRARELMQRARLKNA